MPIKRNFKKPIKKEVIGNKIKQTKVKFKPYDFVSEENVKHQLKIIFEKIKSKKNSLFEFKLLRLNNLIEKIYIDSSSKRLGEGNMGVIYNGILKFKGKPKKRVAIKFFKFDIRDNDIEIYEQIIKKLKEIKLPSGHSLLPKIGFVKVKLLDNYKPIWIQVSSAFITKENGIFVSKFMQNNQIFYSKRTIKEIEHLYRKIIEIGLDPYDLVSQFKLNDSVVPIDLDVLYLTLSSNRGKIFRKKEEKINQLLNSFARVSNKMSFDSFSTSKKILIELCTEFAKNKPEWKKEINKIIKEDQLINYYIQDNLDHII